MTTTRTATATAPDPLDVEDEFLPPLHLVPDVSRAAWAELAAAVVAHNAAEADLVAYMDDHPREQGSSRGSTLYNERYRLVNEGHPLARTAVQLEGARKMAREIFRMQILEHRDVWTAHFDAITRRELDGAGTVITEAIARIRSVAVVPATHERRIFALDRMAEGHTGSSWWEPARSAGRIPVGAQLISLEENILPALEALAAHLTPAPVDDEAAR